MRRHEIDVAVRELAASQYDCFSRAQVLALGGNDSLIRRRRLSGAWITRAESVYGFGTRRPSWWMDLWIAHLDTGLDSVVSHEAAAALDGVTAFPTGPVVLTVRHPSHRKSELATLHQTRYLPAAHVMRHQTGLPVTTLERTFVDLSSMTRRSRLSAAVETAVIEHRIALPKLSACLLSMAVPGRRGIFKLGSIIDELGPGETPPGSVMEAAFLDALRAAGEPLPTGQFPHPGRLPTVGCVDFAYPAACLICEIDGRRWHTRRQDIQRDHARDMAAARAGWDTLRFVYEDLHAWPEDTVDTVRVVRVQREAVVAALS